MVQGKATEGIRAAGVKPRLRPSGGLSLSLGCTLLRSICSLTDVCVGAAVLRQIGKRMATDKMIMCLILGLFLGVVGIIVAKVSCASPSSHRVLPSLLRLGLTAVSACLDVSSPACFSSRLLLPSLLPLARPPCEGVQEHRSMTAQACVTRQRKGG